MMVFCHQRKTGRENDGDIAMALLAANKMGRFMLAEMQSDSYERGADDGCNINLDYPWLLQFIMRHPALLSVAMWLGPDISQH